MKKFSLVLAVVFSLILATGAVAVFAEEAPTPDEVIAKVKEASDYLVKEGDAGLASFNDPEGPWAFKGTYVFVYDCDAGACVGNITPGLVGKKIEDVIDVNGKPVGLELCDASKEPNGWWIEYMWWDPVTETNKPKLSFIYKAPGAKYTVCCGIYSPEGITAADLNAKLTGE